MHIKINKSSLAEALNTVQVVAGAKGSLQILQNVKITAKGSKVEFVCTDLDVTLVANADCEVIEEGATTLPAKQFAAAVGKVVEGTLDLDVDKDDKAILSAGSSVFKFKGMAAKEFPTIPMEDGEGCTMEATALREMLRKTSFAASQDETRKTLQGVLFDFGNGGGEVKSVATDGRRLAILNCTGITGKFIGEYILPRKAVDVLLKKLPKDGNVTLVSAKKQLRIKTERIDFLTKLLDEAYPNYMQVVPKSSNITIPVNRVEFLGALDRISVFTAGEESPCVALTFGENRLVFNSGDTEFGSSRDEIPVKYDGETIELRFNPQYIREVFSAMDEDEVDFFLTNGQSPVIVRKSGSDDYTYVVMPLRV